MADDDHVEEHGRVYHKGGKYVLPNDSGESNRLDKQHVVFTELQHGKLNLAPLDTIPLKNVHDVATGTGIWAMDFAREHPEAQVTGSDIVIPQPTNVPSNCHFIVKDAEEEWDYPHPFEFIHARAVISIFKDPRHFIASAFKALTPGGFLELMDAIYPFGYEDPQPPPNSPLPRWVDLSMKSAVAAGRPWTNTQYYETWMKEAGFINVRSEKAWIAIGAWVEGEDEEAAKKRRLGRMMEENVLSAIDAMAPRMLERLGWKMEDNREFVEAVKEQLTSGKVKSGGWVLTVWGERPAE